MTDETLNDALYEAKRAAKDLASASAKLSRRLLTKAEDAARDPEGSARKATRLVAKELDAAAREIERILNDL